LCHCFLSIATTFTFEAALFGTPIIQYFVSKDERRTEHESALFERLDISDHILNYLLPYLPVAKDTSALVGFINVVLTDDTLRKSYLTMMAVMGFPHERATWNEDSRHFIADLQLA